MTKKYAVGTEAAVEAILSNDNVFVTGPAGSRKSQTIATIRDFFGDSTLFLAPTGVAALNIQGMSCHKACGLSFGVTTADDLCKAKSKKQAMLMSSKAIDRVVIDEVPMVRRDKLYEMDMKFRYYRKNNAPFGGLQVVAFGDGFQIKPVLTRSEEAQYRKMYGSELVFGSDTWNDLDFTSVYLPKVYRQAEPEFAKHLCNIRIGKDVTQAIDFFNYHCYGKGKLPNAVTITTTNKAAEEVNRREFESLPGREKVYKGIKKGTAPELPVPENLALKEGLKVMIVANDSETPPRYVNGTVGIIRRMAASYVSVEVDGEIVPVFPKIWENIVQEPKIEKRVTKQQITHDDGTISEEEVVEDVEVLVDKNVGSFTQFPFRLGYAITGHKVQGLTLDEANVDMGYGAFAAGQTYVMLSRARSLSGLRLARKLRHKDIIVDQEVLKFYADTFPDLSWR